MGHQPERAGVGERTPQPHLVALYVAWAGVLSAWGGIERAPVFAPVITSRTRTGLACEMELKIAAIILVLSVAFCAPSSHAKPISLVERCWCRSTVNTVSQRNIRELRFLHTPNCAFQVIAKLKNNKEVCINPETKWLQQYIKNAINKMKKVKEQQLPLQLSCLSSPPPL
uniref:Stromal cell-derived factor 1 n=1 Tax=Denticeps clupeoides TaxID=299321 RepID=A0AAY4E1T6_9TELE